MHGSPSPFGMVMHAGAREQVVADALMSLPGVNCSNCAIAGTCPAFEEGSLCAYEPLFAQFDVRNAVHIETMHAHLAQVDWRRTMHAVMQERQMGGGALDPKVSSQMDRMHSRLEEMRTMRPSGAPPVSQPGVIKFSVEASGHPAASQAAGGILSRMFGVQQVSDEMPNEPGRSAGPPIELDPTTGRPVA